MPLCFRLAKNLSVQVLAIDFVLGAGWDVACGATFRLSGPYGEWCQNILEFTATAQPSC